MNINHLFDLCVSTLNHPRLVITKTRYQLIALNELYDYKLANSINWQIVCPYTTVTVVIFIWQCEWQLKNMVTELSCHSSKFVEWSYTEGRV